MTTPENERPWNHLSPLQTFLSLFVGIPVCIIMEVANPELMDKLGTTAITLLLAVFIIGYCLFIFFFAIALISRLLDKLFS